jgi:hypothetical protein
MTSNDFGNYYKTISDTELLDILEHQVNYQPLAIEAAKKEFENRKLSDEEISKAKQPLILKKLEKEERKKKIKTIENKVKNASNILVDTLNPIQTETPTTKKLIQFISIAFFAFFLFKVIGDFRMFSEMTKDIARFDRSSFFYFLPFVILPVASVTFWMRKAFGWMISAFFIIYSAIRVIWVLIESFNWKHTEASFDNLYPRPSPVAYIFIIVLLIGMLYVISKPNIREIFKINRQRLVATIFMSSLVAIFLMLEV